MHKRHFRGTDWIRCPNCKQSFPHTELTAHLAQACESSPHPAAYEDGFDVLQERELKSKRLKPKNFTSEYDRWRGIFQVLFPDWQGKVPNPCKFYIHVVTRIVSTDFVLSAGHEFLIFQIDYGRGDICSTIDLTTRLLCDDFIRGIQERADNPEDLRRYLDCSIQRCRLRSSSGTAGETGTQSRNAAAQPMRRPLPLLSEPDLDQDVSRRELALLSPQGQAVSLGAQTQMSLGQPQGLGAAQPEAGTRVSRYMPFPDFFPFPSGQSNRDSFSYSALNSSVSDPDSAWGLSSLYSVEDDTMSSVYSDVSNMGESFGSPSFNWSSQQVPQRSFGLAMNPLQQPTSRMWGTSTMNPNSSHFSFFEYPSGTRESQDIDTGDNSMMMQQPYQFDPATGGFPTFRAGPNIVPIAGNPSQPEARSQYRASASVSLGDGATESRKDNEGGPPGITEPTLD